MVQVHVFQELINLSIMPDLRRWTLAGAHVARVGDGYIASGKRLGGSLADAAVWYSASSHTMTAIVGLERELMKILRELAKR